VRGKNRQVATHDSSDLERGCPGSPRSGTTIPALLSRSLNDTRRQFSSALDDRESKKNARLVQKLREFRRDFIDEISLTK
jgi:hypothetical protein